MPRPLFSLPVRSFTREIASWGVDPSGERFFLVVPPRTQGAGVIEVVTDFHALVSRK
jgi:hypothetical protein